MSPRIRILVCPDSFKGSLSAPAAAAAMARGARRAVPGAALDLLPLADGGEGTVDVLASTEGRVVRLRVPGPLGRPARATLLLLPHQTAIVEIAQAAGLLQVPPPARNPMRTTTFGVGLLIRAAVKRGAHRVIVTLGGSATVDGGAGMAQALGARLVDARGGDIPRGGRGLGFLHSVDIRPLRRLLRGVTVIGATDVRNPLLGPRGAARVFAPQKGATPAQVRALERGLANLARVIRRDIGPDVRRLPGAGAAGGLGAGLAGFLRARLVPGAPLLFRLLGFDAVLRRARLVLTGEGSLDRQTLMGKLVAQVAARARRAGVPAIAFAGRVSIPPAQARKAGLAAAHPISDPRMETGRAMRHAAELLEKRVREVLSGGIPRFSARTNR